MKELSSVAWAYRVNHSISPPHREQNCSVFGKDAEIFLLMSVRMVPQGRSERTAVPADAEPPASHHRHGESNPEPQLHHRSLTYHLLHLLFLISRGNLCLLKGSEPAERTRTSRKCLNLVASTMAVGWLRNDGAWPGHDIPCLGPGCPSCRAALGTCTGSFWNQREDLLPLRNAWKLQSTCMDRPPVTHLPVVGTQGHGLIQGMSGLLAPPAA